MLKKLLFLFFLTSIFCYSQNSSTILYGKVIDNNNVIYNANVYNLTTKQGTITDKEGKFKIFAKENDSLQISSVGYMTAIFIPKAFNFGMNKNHITLEKTNIVLDEVMLKKHNLTGNLSIDIKKTPKDSIGNLVKSMVESIHNLDYSAIASMDIGLDEMHLRKMSTNVIPNSFKGGTLFRSSIGGKSGLREKTLNRKLEEKSKLPGKILNEFGAYFFFEELKIPKENYHHFISYCSNKNILKLYNDKELLKLIRIFQDESIKYLKSIK